MTKSILLISPLLTSLLFISLLFISCNPQPTDSATNDTPTTTFEECIQCNIGTCLANEFCDIDGIYTNPPGCLSFCKQDDAMSCEGNPSKCIFYKDGLFVCDPKCNKIMPF